MVIPLIWPSKPSVIRKAKSTRCWIERWFNCCSINILFCPLPSNWFNFLTISAKVISAKSNPEMNFKKLNFWIKIRDYIFTYTRGKNLNTLLKKYYNDFLNILSSGRRRDEVSKLYVGGLYVIPLGSKYTNFQERITSGTSCRKT